MDFTLSKKHEMARTLFKEFAENEVKPLAQDVDENEQFPEETVAKMAKSGFLGIPVPKEYGGQGCRSSYIHHVCRRIIKGMRYNRRYRICSYIFMYRSDHDIRYRRAETEISSGSGFR